jgi:hypothetical protein
MRVAGVEPGTHEITVVWEVGVAPAFDKPALENWVEERMTTIRVLPAGSVGVELVDDPGMREAVIKSLGLSGGIQLSRTDDGNSEPHLGFGIRCMNPPMDLAFDLVVRERLEGAAGEGVTPREWVIGPVAFTRGSSHNHGGGSDAPGFDAAAVDLVLRPSVSAAQGTLGVYKIWDGEVVFRNVPIVGREHNAPIDPRKGQTVLPEAETP